MRHPIYPAIPVLAMLATGATAQEPTMSTPVPSMSAPAEQHLRGDILAVSGDTVTVRSRQEKTVKIELSSDTRVSVASKANLYDIGQNDFIGTTAVPQMGGSLRALEVHLFPESMRGAGEGHRPWDLRPGSTMTNATVSQETGAAPSSTMTNATAARVSRSSGGLTLLLKYPEGEKTVMVPKGTPVVKLEPGDRSRMVPGAHLFAAYQSQPDGKLIAQRVVVGENGVVPPM